MAADMSAILSEKPFGSIKQHEKMKFDGISVGVMYDIGSGVGSRSNITLRCSANRTESYLVLTFVFSHYYVCVFMFF